MTAPGRDPRPSPQRAYLALGSNVGDRAGHLQRAIDALVADDHTEVVAISNVYATAPVGGPDQDDYLNAVVAVETTRTPHELLVLAHDIEASEQRVRTVGRCGAHTLAYHALSH